MPTPTLLTADGLLLDASVCGDLVESLSREWLVTNGIGGYAMGTIAGAATRRYHGLLVAATLPPAERTMVIGKLEERLVVRGVQHDLSSNCWRDGTIAPKGFNFLRSFRLERGLPVWRWELDGIALEKRIAMVHGVNAVLVEYRLLPGSPPCELRLDCLVCHRSHHDLAPDASWAASIARHGDDLLVRLPATANASQPQELWLHCTGAEVQPVGAWWREIDLPVERSYGYDDRSSLLHAGTFTARLTPGRRTTFGGSLGLPLPRDPQLLLVAEQARRQSLAECCGVRRDDPLRYQAVFAADNFVVRRPSPVARDGWSIIAGYPWFADWSRDTLLALPGLLLATGRHPAARSTLETYARHLSGGMLPNRFPDRPGARIEHNSVDAPLLFIRALGLLQDAEPNLPWLRTMWPSVVSIIECFERGARHGIAVDPADGLLRAGEPGLQLTWMDAKVDGRVITPRIGKPVEVNALWYSALRHAEAFSLMLGQPSLPWSQRAERVLGSFGRFWNDSEGCLYDCLDGPDGADPSVRPNQILAAGLEHSPLAAGPLRAVTQRVADQLWVPIGLRTLAPSDPRYRGRHVGSIVARDEAYHQGTAWPWLLPFFVRAWNRSGGDAATVIGIREALATHLGEGGIGSVSEIVDGDAPHTPRGCQWQAWRVGALLEILDAPTPRSESGLDALVGAIR